MSPPVLPCALIPQGLPPWGVVVQGISEGFSLFARCPLGPFLIVELLHPLLLFFLGGGRKIFKKLLKFIDSSGRLIIIDQ